jgi:predicted dehydrogenase
MMNRKIKWGILGCARIAQSALIPAIQEAKNGVLYGIAARDEKRARDWARKYKFQKFYRDYQALLDDPDIDAVYIPLPNNLHCEWTCHAAKAGKHVLCEKPLALNSGEVRKMIREADKADVTLMEAFMYRFHPQIKKTLQLLESGEIGNVRFIRSSFTFMYIGDEENYRWSPEMGGGALYDVGCYTINVARLVFNEEPISIYARAHFHPRFKVDLSTSMLLEFPRNRVALLDCSFESQFQSYFEIVGTEGRITLPRSYSAKLLDAPIVVLKGDKIRTITIPSANQYTRMVENFGECILKSHLLSYSAEDSYNNMQVVDAAFRSIRTGQPVKL